jgi:hypothetical protein
MADRYWVAGGTGNYNSTTNWSATSGGASGASFPDVSDNIFFNASSGVGTATINVASQCANLNLTGFLGTLAFTNSLTVNGLILNFGLGTYTVTGTGFLIYALANNTFSITSNGTIWTGNLRIGNLQPTITFVDNFSITGNLELRSAGVTTFNGSTLFVGGSLAFLTGGFIQGTTNIVFNGTGTWSHTFSTGYLRNNITINTAGTLTLGANIGYGTSTLTYTAGTVVTTGSTLNIATNTTLNTNGITWNNITANGSTAITLGSNLTLIGTLTITNGTLSFVLGGFSLISINANLTLGVASSTFTMPANQTFKTLTITGANTSVNANTLTITENLIINNSVSGTTAIIYAGTGTWSASSSLAIINNIFTINTAGTLTISGIVYKATGLFTYIAGTIIDTGATVIINGPTTLNISGKTWNKLLVNNIITLSSNINATTFGTTGANATSFVLGGNTLNFTNLELGNSGTTTLPTAWVCQNIEFVNISAGVLNTNSITINGNILQSGGSTYSGTTTFTYAGTGTWIAPSINSYFTSSFTINTAGTLTIISANIGGGIFTYTAGTVITTGSTLNIRQSGTTMNDGIIIWYNVVSPTNVTTLILNNQLVCSNALTIDDSQVTFSGADGTFDVYYLNLNSQGIIARTPKLVSLKTYRVRAGFTSQGTLAFPITLQSTVAASQAIFTVDPGATINVGFVNTKDINSSLGRPIYSYKGVFINTLNWNLLPTNVTPKVNTFAN